MRISKGFSNIALGLGIIIATLLNLTDCDIVTDKPKLKEIYSNNIYQRDSPKDIPEPELLPVLHGNDTRCRISEYLCTNKKCIPINRYCDGSNDCGDSSDEPRHCTHIAVGVGDQLIFYSTNGTKTVTLNFESQNLAALAYDNVQNMMLYVDKQNDNDAIYGYYLSSMEFKYLLARNGRNIQGLAYDPATEKLFFTDTKEKSINWISLKPGFKNNVNGNLLLKMHDGFPTDIAIDSCRGYIYWINTSVTKPAIERARFDGSDREVVINPTSLSINTSDKLEPHSLVIDPQTQKMFWVEPESSSRFNTMIADLNGNNKKIKSVFKIYPSNKVFSNISNVQTVSKNSLISWNWCANCSLFEEPKIEYGDGPKRIFRMQFEIPVSIVANYAIEHQTQGLKDCKTLTSLVGDNSLFINSKKIATEYEGPFCVHGEKVKGHSRCKCEPGYTGERCDVSVCNNYCMQGDCSFNDEGGPKCSCNAGYSGARCEISACLGYCQNHGTCSLNANSKPVCQCRTSYAGDRCENTDCLNFCMQGNCSFSEDGRPTCSCNAGYTGERCEVSVCHGYCLNDGDCSLNEEDEPVCQCVGCNKTYYGDIGRTYELELHRPREDLVPYVCLLTITAAGGIHGDLVQVLFDSFTLGRFTSFTEAGCPDGYMQIQEASRPQVGGSWCGTSWGPSIYYSETKSITLIIRLLHLSKEQNNYNFDFRMAYKVLRREYATVRYGGTPPSERPFFKLRPIPYPVNISRGEDTSVTKTTKTPEYYLGDLISGTYCSRIFSDCDRKNCRLQSPNFPGVYPRNLTCYYAVRQHEVPQGKHALIVVKQPNGQLVSIRSQKAMYAAAQQERGNNGRELKFWQQCDEVQDYVTVYDGYTTRDPVILRFCGGGVSVPEAISSGPELLVEFTTSPFGTFLQPVTSQSLHGFQLEVEVRFVDQQSPTYAKNKRACEFWIRGTGRGILEHPQHSLPPNTTCLYHMQGIDTSGPSGRNIIYRRPSFSAPRFRVWFSVLKFYVTNALNPNLPEDEYCGSHLNIWDGPMRISPGCSDIFCDKERSVQMSRATSPQSVTVGRPPTNATLVARFCRERAPRTCEHALLRRSRACAKTESFLSKGDSLTLELKLTQGTALKPVYFKALYEFVDLHQDGEPWGRGSCSRRFASRSFPEAPPDPPITFSSPRDVFLYGRGGNRNISCTYRFEANPGEVVRVRVWGIRSGGRLCRSVHSAHSPWYRCAGDITAAVRIFDKPWRDGGSRIPRDCLCSDVGDYEFTSLATVAELRFDVVNMSALDDFRSFGFEASVEFVRLESGCETSHRVYGASGEMRLASANPMSESERCERRPWLIDPSPGRYLYLQIRGSIIREPELDNFTLLNNITVAPDMRHLCRTPNRIAVYTGGLIPTYICPEPPEEQIEDMVEVFSDGWSREVDPLARHVFASPSASDHFDLDWPRALSVELIAVEPASYFVTWLELSRRHASSHGGVFALSGECEYRCASLDACIAAALWCDGIPHCPRGEDERLAHCSALLRVPAHYAVMFLALTVLAAFAVIAAARSCRRRRSALQQRLKSLSSDTAIFDEKEVIC